MLWYIDKFWRSFLEDGEDNIILKYG